LGLERFHQPKCLADNLARRAVPPGRNLGLDEVREIVAKGYGRGLEDSLRANEIVVMSRNNNLGGLPSMIVSDIDRDYSIS